MDYLPVYLPVNLRVKKILIHFKIVALQVRDVRFVFFQNERIFVQLDELDELDKVTHA